MLVGNPEFEQRTLFLGKPRCLNDPLDLFNVSLYCNRIQRKTSYGEEVQRSPEKDLSGSFHLENILHCQKYCFCF